MLDPEAKAFLDEMAAAQRPALSSLSPVEARRLAYDLLALGGESQPVARVEDRQIPSPFGKIPIRIYVPAADGPLPVLIYFHGGGWVVCDLETHDSICRRLPRGGGGLPPCAREQGPGRARRLLCRHAVGVPAREGNGR